MKNWNGKYDWASMKKSPWISSCSDNAKTQLATLMFENAEGCKSSYNINGTSTNLNNTKKFFKTRGYSSDSIKNYKYSLVKSSIDNGRPVIIRGDSFKDYTTRRFLWWTWQKANYSGHAWIIDGYCNLACTATKKNNPLETKVFSENYVHCNYGWSGTSNGYYISNVFTTHQNANAKDDEIPRSAKVNGYYNKNIKILTNIRH